MDGPWRSSLLSILMVEVAAFIAAALIHLGFFAPGFEHAGAAAAEGLIAVVLLVGLVGASVFPSSARSISLATQGFALVGTLVGILMIIFGVGPRTAPDIVFPIFIVVLLTTGIARSAGAPWRPFSTT